MRAEDIERRLDALEARAAHQDQILEDLHQMSLGQWQRIDLLTRRLEALQQRLTAWREAGETDGPPDQPPPHY